MPTYPHRSVTQAQIGRPELPMNFSWLLDLPSSQPQHRGLAMTELVLRTGAQWNWPVLKAFGKTFLPHCPGSCLTTWVEGGDLREWKSYCAHVLSPEISMWFLSLEHSHGFSKHSSISPELKPCVPGGWIHRQMHRNSQADIFTQTQT